MKNGKYIKAVQTDYAGVTFRSKTEALFAAAMDSTWGLEWEYEPENFGGDYTPDFFVLMQAGFQAASLSVLIELKPALPTDAYFDKLSSWSKAETPDTDIFFMWIGSPFERDKKDYFKLLYSKHSQRIGLMLMELFIERIGDHFHSRRRLDLRPEEQSYMR